MFTGASNVTVNGGTFVKHTHLGSSAFDKLSVAAAHSALHNAPTRTNKTRCLQNTRMNILEHLDRWAQGICDEGASIFWLHGGAGAGKSAIMQTLAERWADQQLVLGSFFFFRGDSTRNTAEVLVPTLVYQLAQLFPSSREILDPIILHDPLIFKKSLETQSLSLLVPCLQFLVRLGRISEASQSPSVFLIDGLDECNDTAQQYSIIQTVAAVCHEHHIPVKFLIASRPEHNIMSSFDWYKQVGHVLGSILLSNDPDANDDIRRFIEDEFQKICTHHRFKNMIPSEWPDFYDINTLVCRASSHFIYASTVMKYIWSAKESPVRSLQVVLGLEVSRTISPFSELDAVYHHILGSAAHRHQVLQVLAHCICTDLPTTPKMICSMLDCTEDDLFIYLADVAPLVALSESEFSEYPESTEDEKIVRVLHLSLEDFLCDPDRSGPLHIKEEDYLTSKFERCFELLDVLTQPPPSKCDWPEHLFHQRIYRILHTQVISTIWRVGHLVIIQEILTRYTLLDLFYWRLRCANKALRQLEFATLEYSVEFFDAVHRITSEAITQVQKRSLHDILNILHHYIQQTAPLPAAVLTILFMGYPAEDLGADSALRLSRDSDLVRKLIQFTFYLTNISTVDLASIQQSVNPSERLAVATEIILAAVFADADPRDYYKYYWWAGHWGNVETKIVKASDILDILQWALPKAGISEKIALYSSRTFPQRMSDYTTPRTVSLVQKCLADYAARVQDTKRKELDSMIDNGDSGALIRKSRMLLINNQD